MKGLGRESKSAIFKVHHQLIDCKALSNLRRQNVTPNRSDPKSSKYVARSVDRIPTKPKLVCWTTCESGSVGRGGVERTVSLSAKLRRDWELCHAREKMDGAVLGKNCDTAYAVWLYFSKALYTPQSTYAYVLVI